MKNKLKGRSQVGIFVKIFSVEIVELIAHAGLDFIVIDMEHSPMNFQEIKIITAVAQGLGVNVVVRTRDFQGSTILHALDLGVNGLQIPQVDNKEDAKKIVNYSKYTPIGSRGVAFSQRASKYGFMTPKESMENGNNAVITVHIETKEALENVHEIAGTEGIDVLFVGPTDLSYSLGVDSDYINGGLKEAFEKIKSECHKNNKQLGLIINDEKKLRFCLENDVKYIIWGSDVDLLKKELINVKQIINNNI